jgi:hypothetical protein
LISETRDPIKDWFLVVRAARACGESNTEIRRTHPAPNRQGSSW